MKYKRLIILSVVFFLLVHTAYFWAEWIDILAILVFPLLLIVFMALAGLFFSHLVKLIKERFRNRQRLIVSALLFVVTGTALLRATGIINYEWLAGKDLLIAEIEGAANCTTVLKLKEDNTFIESSYCWGTTKIRGDYSIKGDTVFFTNVKPGRSDKKYYLYATIIKKNKIEHGTYKTVGDLMLYKSSADTTGHKRMITKNDFPL